ncbi:hypothetical protein BKH41_00720 [Helicobacter sp. 12S02232-10]|uniref:hypothetical protein n=1 Tax=Helicobacter sp. 12S02232-10 TaxID=1476197 RepID=UPI000BA76988|nr:hypothetical protein [Helicobacter sp. 12S02232-10]PAF49858.1 hypothetical protein BKH41_00720 [Helicobacter sp. 12S02232-10]
MRFLGFLIILMAGGLTLIEFSRLKMYGILSDSEVDMNIDKVVELLDLGANKEDLRALLRETAKTESNYGKTPDFTPDSGKGIFQIDKIGFDEAINQPSRIKNQVLKIGYDLDRLDYSDKRVTQDALLNTILARLYYYKKPKIPSTREGRAAFWKKYYNSILGAGTEQAYLERTEALYG